MVPARLSGFSCPPGLTGTRSFRPALGGRVPPPGAELPHGRASGAGTARTGTRGPAAGSAPPALQARSAPPSARPFLGGTAWRSPPHLTSLGSRPVSLRIFSSTCLRLSLAFSSCSCSARTATAILPAARPGRAPRKAALGNRGNRPASFGGRGPGRRSQSHPGGLL